MRCVVLRCRLSAGAYPPGHLRHAVLSCPAHVVNDLVTCWYLRQKAEKAEKVYTCTWYVAYVAYAREKFWNMPCVHAMYMYIV